MTIKLKSLLETEDGLKSIRDIKPLIHQLLSAAQHVYDRWDQSDKENGDSMVGFGGICQDIADQISGVLNSHGFDATTVSAQIGEQHVWTVFKVQEGVYEIDISPYTYERGGGYNWKKIPDVKFDINDLMINRLSSDPNEFDNYIDV